MNNLDYLRKSEIREMSLECENFGGINLSQGICDFPLSKVLRDGAIKAMDAGHNHYTRHDGEDAIRRAIAKKARAYNHISYANENNVIVTCGATGALFCVCKALFEEGDEIILFEPYYGYHEYTFKFLNLSTKYVKLSPPNWEINIREIEETITSRTKAILINTPLNPTGKVFTREELIELAKLCDKYNLIVLTDEIYEYILYDNREHISPGSMDEFKDRVITISGFSKTFSITGWRIGYCICPPQFVAEVGYVADLLYVCAPAPLQLAVAEALEKLDEKYYLDMRDVFHFKREMICDTLEKIGLQPFVPQGAYYVMADIAKLPGSTGKEKVMWLLKNTGVAAVPGEAFFHNPSDGYNLARFCFAKTDEELKMACEALDKLRGEK